MILLPRNSLNHKGITMYSHLFRSIKINKIEIKNRIIYPALGLCYSHDRRLNNRYYNFFRERARGGAGIVTVGPVGIDFIGSGNSTLSLADDEAIPSFRKLTGIIREEGATPWIQLFHAGAYIHPRMIGGREPIAPSPIFSDYSKTIPKEMTLEDIEEVQEAFVRAAQRAQGAGFEGVELIGSAGYLISQFLSPVKNKRTDGYGGSFENRVRFPREVVSLIRNALGPDYPITIRMSGNDFVSGSNTDSETPRIAKIYQNAGIDAVNVTGGWHETRVPQLPMEVPRAAYAFLAHNIKKAIDVPVVASNRIPDPNSAETILKDGCADMVSLGRVLIADPEWPKKALEGRADEIRPCVACSQGCTDQIFSGKPVFCVGNARAGYEGERNIVRSDSPKKVMVVGAGAGGMEAAVTAAVAGHQVTLFEKKSDIGGQLCIAGAPPNKRELKEFVRYYRAMISKLDILLRLNTEVDLDVVRNEDPDYVIVAEGAEAFIPSLEGIDDPSVITAWDLLMETSSLGREVAIIGGGAVGLETALFVAGKGTIKPETLYFLFAYEAEPGERLRELMFKGFSHVTVFEMLPVAGKDLGLSTKWILDGNLKRCGIDILTNAKVVSIKDGVVTYESDTRKEQMQFDNVVIASGSRSVQRLSKKIETLGIPFTVIGDGVKPGKLDDAIHGGFLAAMNI